MASQAPPPVDPTDSVSPSIQATAQTQGPQLEEALANLVEPKKQGDDGKTDLDVHDKHGSKSGSKHAWLQRFFPRESVDKLFAHEHMGNFVYVRATGEEIFEEMPLYVRLGMHLLFVSSNAVSYPSVESLLLAQSVKQGKVYDAEGPEVLPHIQAFVNQFNLNTSDLLEEDLSKYKSFNAFFSRSLKPAARPIASSSDPSVLVSSADCRLTVWDSVDKAKQVWIKGMKFSIPALLGNEEYAKGLGDQGVGLAVFRLAPEDYHRFHSPVEGTLGPITHIPGSLYTVNPQAVNEDLNVFTSNSRSILPITLPSGQTIYIVAVGAMLVGSISWAKGVEEGKTVKKGEELGWFSYGGSTVIACLPQGWGTFDADLKEKSEKGMEVLVKVGEQIGKVAASP